MLIARGEVWRITIGTLERTVLVVESDAALKALPATALVLMVDESGRAPDTVVTVPLTEPVNGHAVAVDITALRTATIGAGRFLGMVPSEQMAMINRSLRVALDLT